MKNIKKYALIFKNMQKIQNMQKFAKICKIWRFSNIAQGCTDNNKWPDLRYVTW